MKKFLIVLAILLVIYFAYDFAVYSLGWYIDLNPDKEISTNITVKDEKIFYNNEEFQIKGVNLGASIPGEFITDFAISKITYLNWFKQIQEMGANTIKIYTIYNPEFYEALKEFNDNNDNPLYLIQGIWLDDYIKNASVDAYDSRSHKKLLDDAKTTIDVIYGKRKVFLGRTIGSGVYNIDVSDYVLGYLIGDEWVDNTIAYTDDIKADNNKFDGKYIKTTDDATAFEALLASVANTLIEYETNKYKSQRLVSFISSPQTDPFDYPEKVARHFKKIVKLDIEHLTQTDDYKSGLFASYNVYSFYPDFEAYDENLDIVQQKNSYITYLEKLNNHHTIPIVITEFGYSSSRGMSKKSDNENGSQGGMSEQEQADYLAKAYRDIKAVGINSAIIATWQDEWHKKSWNTIEKINVTRTPYWNDYQTSAQSYGLLTFDPGDEKSVAYVDGDINEWTDTHLVTKNGNQEIYSKYDEKYMYFMIKGYNKEITYIPLDLTQKSGSKYVKDLNINFNRDADFLIIIDGKYNSRILVQERYDELKAINSYELNDENAYANIPSKSSDTFNPINMLLESYMMKNRIKIPGITFETGKLNFGIGNPNYQDFNSLSDFYIKNDIIEIRIPWQLMNFSDPSNMLIHDDYYKNYGVEDIPINKLYLGLGTTGTINMTGMSLIPWKNKITYHERLKASYYEIQKLWNEEEL